MNESSFHLRIYGQPVPQGRPRATVIGGHAHVYERKQDKAWKGVVRDQVIAEIRKRELLMWPGAVRLDLVFLLDRPKTLPKKVHYHVKRPDCDNLAKSVKDALRGLLYKDDSQVVLLTVRKVYADQNDQPGVYILALREEGL